jgi:hypothetical protein
MYTGSLVIHAFGNDTTTGPFPPYSTLTYFGIPLTGQCKSGSYHAKETLAFPTTPTGTQVFTFTIPAYGGQVANLDTNGDGVPDIISGCGRTSLRAGDPLSGVGPVNTTGVTNTARATNDPRGFTLPAWALRKRKSGASLSQYGVYLWEVHFADLRNDAGSFAKNGGDGTFAVAHSGKNAKRGVIQTAGNNKFGGVMRLLGSYGDNEGYLYNGAVTTVAYFNWLFDYLGHGGQATDGGVVTAGYTKSHLNYFYTRASGYRGTSTVYAEVFKWTTGTVTVTALGGTFPTILQRKGYDNRTPMGSGAVQLVSPMLTKWVGAGSSTTASIGIMKVHFAPEPREWVLLASGVSTLGLMAWRRGRRP